MVNKIYLKGKIELFNENEERVFNTNSNILFDFLNKIQKCIIVDSLELKNEKYSLILKYSLKEYPIGNKDDLIKIDLSQYQYDLINKAYNSISFNFENLFKNKDFRNNEFDIIIKTKVGYCNG